MIRIFFIFCLVSFYRPASAQVADTTNTTASGQRSAASLEAEARARDEAFARWKALYAGNRAKVAQEIKAVRQELSQLDPAKNELKQQLTNLLNGTIRRWNEEKTDYADTEQFAECQDLFATIRKAIQEGALK